MDPKIQNKNEGTDPTNHKMKVQILKPKELR